MSGKMRFRFGLFTSAILAVLFLSSNRVHVVEYDWDKQADVPIHTWNGSDIADKRYMLEIIRIRGPDWDTRTTGETRAAT